MQDSLDQKELKQEIEYRTEPNREAKAAWEK